MRKRKPYQEDKNRISNLTQGAKQKTATYISMPLILAMLMIQLLPRPGHAQQDPIFSQYMFNTLAINPAFAGTKNMLNAMFLSRHQWVGFEGAPSTQCFTGHSPLTQKNVALGLSILKDHVGPVNQTGIYADYAYKLQLSQELKLSLGLKGGFNYYRLDVNSLNRLATYNDMAYNQSVSVSFLPNVGFGLYLYSSRFFVGASAPKLVENDYAHAGTNATGQPGEEVRHFFISSGYLLPLSNEVSMQPGFLITLARANAPSIDVSANCLFKEILWIGAMYRISKSVGATFQYQVNHQLRVGYAYEMSTSALQNYNSGTHEIMVGFELNFKKDHVQSPRFF